jgi:hypothetical protein
MAVRMERRRTIKALIANSTHGGRSQEVSNRWLGSQMSVPNLKGLESFSLAILGSLEDWFQRY